jgi:hypothetical protein
MLFVSLRLMEQESMARDVGPALVARAADAGRDEVPLNQVLDIAAGNHDVLASGAWPFRCATDPERAAAVARSLALACAERVAATYADGHPGDARVERCTRTTRRFLRGEATAEELITAEADAFAAAREASMQTYPEARNPGWAAASAAMDAAYAARSDAATVSWALWAAAEMAVVAGGPEERGFQTTMLRELLQQSNAVPEAVVE